MPGKVGVPQGVLVLKLKEMREAAGMTRDQLASRTGVNCVTIARAEKGLHIRKKNAQLILQALGQNGHAPAMPAVRPVVLDVEDSLVTAFKLLLEELDKRIDERVRRGAIAPLPIPRGPVIAPGPSYVPPPVEADVVLTQPVAISAGFPVTSAINNWKIRYEKKFLKEYEVSGLTGPIRSALQKFASLGEVYSGLGFTKLERSMVRERAAQLGRAAYEFRVNRRWRVLVRKDVGDKAYTITRLVHHDELE